MSLRNLFAHRARSLVVGFVLLLVAMLVVGSVSIVDAMSMALERNVTATLAGDLHVFSNATKTVPALLGDKDSRGRTLPIWDADRVIEVLSEEPLVRAVVPLGSGVAVLNPSNELDTVLGDLRRSVGQGDQERVADLKDRARGIIARLGTDIDSDAPWLRDVQDRSESRAAVARVSRDEFWNNFEADPLAGLEILENEIARLLPPKEAVGVRFVGTEFETFINAFDRFEWVRGGPENLTEDSIIMSVSFLERALPNEVVVEFRNLYEDVVRDGRALPVEIFAERARWLDSQSELLVRDIDEESSDAIAEQLRVALRLPEAGLHALVKEILTVTADNLAIRYAMFHEIIVPVVNSYRLALGDQLVLHSQSPRGYPTAAKVTVSGIYRFEGLREAVWTSGFALIGLDTYRELRGEMGSVNTRELVELQKAVGVADLPNEELEDSLFGGSDSLEEVAESDLQVMPLAAPQDSLEPLEAAPANTIGHAAIVIEDGADAESVLRRLTATAQARELRVQIVPWQETAGDIAGYHQLVSLQLKIAVAMILLVSWLVITTTVVIATLARTREIGTLRALGTQRRNVFMLVVVEIGALASVASALGAGLASILIQVYGQQGIPAPSFTIEFLFGGPRLVLANSASLLFTGMLLPTLVGIVASLLPARLATRVTPDTALRAEL